MFGPSDCALGAQVLKQLLFQDTARLHIKASIDRIV